MILAQQHGQFNNLPEPNIFVGKAGLTYTTRAIFYDRAIRGVVEEDIQNFQIDLNGNISCRIDKSWFFSGNAFRNTGAYLPANGITYFFDDENRCVNLDAGVFRGQASFIGMKCEAWQGNTSTEGMNGTNNVVNNFYFPNLQTLGTRAIGSLVSKDVYVPNLINIAFTAPSANGLTVGTNGTIYANPSLETSGAGGTLDPCLQWNVDNRSATIIFVADQTPPSAINNLSLGTITSNSAIVNFTPPSSLNGLRYYDVFMKDGSILKRFLPHQKITASGTVISGLTSNTQYECSVYAYSDFGTRSLISNKVNFITL